VSGHMAPFIPPPPRAAGSLNAARTASRHGRYCARRLPGGAYSLARTRLARDNSLITGKIQGMVVIPRPLGPVDTLVFAPSFNDLRQEFPTHQNREWRKRDSSGSPIRELQRANTDALSGRCAHVARLPTGQPSGHGILHDSRRRIKAHRGRTGSHRGHPQSPSRPTPQR
jgi:hypothetical protein